MERMLNAVEIDNDAARGGYIDWSDEQRSAVSRALDELLADQAFKHSRRCSVLLRGLVERVLAGNFRALKERALGVEVFGRQPDYDTNADPIVRMAANEIRKRLAQFYQQPGHHEGLRIRLVPGSYVPEFDFPAGGTAHDQPVAETAAQIGPAIQVQPEGPGAAASADRPEALPGAHRGIHAGTPPAADAAPVADAEPHLQGAGIAGVTHRGNRVAPEPPVPLIGSDGSAQPADVHSGADALAAVAATSPPAGRRRWIFAAAAALIAAAVIALGSFGVLRSAQYRVWQPLLQSAATAVICLSDDGSLQKPVAATPAQDIADIIASGQVPANSAGTGTSISLFGDVNAAHKVSLWLAEHGKGTVLRPSTGLTLWGFRNAPTVLIGYLDNPWSLVLLSHLRYRVAVDPATHAAWIEDQKNPAQRQWMVGAGSGAGHVDYAVISRFLSPDTGNWIVAVAGLGPGGTTAATQLLTDRALNRLLPAGVHAGNNFQMVIRADDISGEVTAPQVLAFHTW